MLLSPLELPFFDNLRVLRISSFVGVHHLIGISLVAGGVYGGSGGKFSSSIHLFFCSVSFAISLVPSCPFWPFWLGKRSCYFLDDELQNLRSIRMGFFFCFCSQRL
ncbi:hypothetical protein DPMN_133380 [Dreissena polymorpha]|uniref:Uncharacterized protein n=1 Tax=Dreissena polymorpha TaxID=45954 RepID=A0A9D4JDY0_DREPO|nr:hypothetical protein DPMN_133380 [Dreissena polymorpha]